jgi:predicted PurR-regulated permease PerM
MINASTKENGVNGSVPYESSKISSINISLTILVIIAIIYTLDWAQSFFITLLLGIFTAYSLNPLVSSLEKLRINRVISSTIITIMILVAVGAGSIAIKGQVDSIISKLPEASKKITSMVTAQSSTTVSSLQKMQLAASQVENVTSDADSIPKKHATMQVEIKDHKFKLSDFLLKGSLQIAGAFGQLVTVITLAYFLLNSGDLFKRKLVKLTGPTLTNKKITVSILQDISQSIQSYLFMQLVTNIVAGLLTWMALKMIGLENAGAWGVAAGILHTVPYFGPLIATILPAIAAYMQFNSIEMVLVVVAVSMIISTLVGVLLTTWMTGRFARMNSPAVFISLIFFTWLWGFWGMILGIPIIAVVKVFSEHIEYLWPVAEILGE